MAKKNEPIDFNSIFCVKTANATIEEATDQAMPRKLYKDYWLEGEVCCLFSDTNLGKTILAVQIAEEISKMVEPENGNVLYYDFELTGKQFQMRYTDEKTNEHHQFPENFKRVELACSNMTEQQLAHLEDIIIAAIEHNINEYNSRYVIVDNISWLVNMKDSPALAGKLMMRLVDLKKKYNLSLLVIAHTIKRDTYSLLTLNNLQGSKRFANFFDAVFAIGQDPRKGGSKYLKQLKVRSGAFINGTENVELVELKKEGTFLGFHHTGNINERTLLRGANKKSGISNEGAADSKEAKAARAAQSRSVTFINALSDSAFDDAFFSKKKKVASHYVKSC